MAKKMKIKKGDEVLVIAGKDKGKKGSIISVDTKNSRVIVEGVNISKKHIKNTPNVTQSGIVDKESPISISNVLFVDPESSQAGKHEDRRPVTRRQRRPAHSLSAQVAAVDGPEPTDQVPDQATSS